MPSDDAWIRDVGPTFVVDDGGDRRGIDWVFNAWGGLYDSWAQDDVVAARVLEHHGDMGYRAPLVLEGGSIDVDGEGTVLTTEQCLLNPNRNPSLSRAEIEGALRDQLGIDRVVWLGHGVVDDETSGHIDNLVCFVRPGIVGLTWTDDPRRPSTRGLPRRSKAARRGRVRRPTVSVARPLVHDRRGSGRHRGGARHETPRRGRSSRGLVRQLLRRERCDRGALARRAARRRGARDHRLPLPRPCGRRCPRAARFCSAEGTSTASRNRCPAVPWSCELSAGARGHPEGVRQRSGHQRVGHGRPGVRRDRFRSRHRAPARAVPRPVLLPDRAPGLVRLGVHGGRGPGCRRDRSSPTRSGGPSCRFCSSVLAKRTTTRWRSSTTATCSASTASCIPDGCSTRRSSTSTPATPASRPGRHGTA